MVEFLSVSPRFSALCFKMSKLAGSLVYFSGWPMHSHRDAVETQADEPPALCVLSQAVLLSQLCSRCELWTGEKALALPISKYLSFCSEVINKAVANFLHKV